MIPTNEQYERIGRYLDGEPVALIAAEVAVAEEIRDDERRVGAMLEVSARGGAVERAWQEALLTEIRRDEAAVAALLDADVPRRALRRAHNRVLAELARRRRRLVLIGAAASAVAAAAGVLLAVSLWLNGPGTTDRPGQVARWAGSPVPVEVITASVQQEDAALDLLAAEIDQLEAEVVASAPPAPLDLGIDQVERALEEFWLDDMLD